MTFILLAVLWQIAAHYLDWRRFSKSPIPQPIFLMVNYVIGVLGFLLAYELWASASSVGWVLAVDIDLRWMLIFLVVSSGMAVGMCYLADLLVARGNNDRDQHAVNLVLLERINELEEELRAKNQGT